MTILLYMTQQTFQSQIASLFERSGVSVALMQSIDAAFEYIENTTPAVCMFEAKKNELSFLSLLRKVPAISEIPFILFVSSVDIQLIRACMNVGATEVISFPLQDSEIVEKLGQYIPSLSSASLSAETKKTESGESSFNLHESNINDTDESEDDFLLPPHQPLPIPQITFHKSTVMNNDSDEESCDETNDNINTPPKVNVQSDHQPEVIVGQFEEDPEDSDVPPPAPDLNACQPIPVSAKLRDVMNIRLAILRNLDVIEAERTKLLSVVPKEIGEEFISRVSNYNRDLRELPSGDVPQRRLDALEKSNEKFKEQLKSIPASLHSYYEKDRELQFRQWKLLLQRVQIIPALIDGTKYLYESEPLYQILHKLDFSADLLYAFTCYTLSLESLRNRAMSKLSSLSNSDSGQANKGGLFGMFSSKSTPNPNEERAREAERSQVLKLLSHVQLEIQAHEKILLNEFWKTYEATAVFFGTDKILPIDQPAVRAFLRYGLLSSKPTFIPSAAASVIMNDCEASIIVDPEHAESTDYVLYADEYIDMIAHKRLQPCVDEDLEQNRRNTPAWQYDKAMRRCLFSDYIVPRYQKLAASLQQKAQQSTDKINDAERNRANLHRGTADAKALQRKYMEIISVERVNATRFSNAANKILTQFIPDAQERLQSARAKMSELLLNQTAEELVKAEVAAIRRMGRLCAKLKESFPPFSLRDQFKPGTESVNNRPAMLESLSRIESGDALIFKDTIIQNEKKDRRIYLRMAPVILITPTSGFMGFSWTPRFNTDPGRLAFPLYCPRTGMRQKMLSSAFSDFRWDTQKAAAGMDIMHSDTIVAAFMNVRWIYRKKSREAREKAGIFNEINDRLNWRRFYALWLDSAMDQGKKVFFKNKEVYELIVKYIGMPAGVERIRL